MNLIISVASVAVVVISAVIVARFARLRLTGTDPVAFLTFMSILFTSGLMSG